MTAAACAACLIVFVGLTARGDNASWDRLARWGYLPGNRVWDGGYWALLTSVFVHLEAWHLAFNVYWLWHLGGAVERVLGRARWLAFFVAAAVLSSADQLAASGQTGYGASGVAYALFGFMWTGRHEVPAFTRILRPNVATLFWVWLVGCVIATQAGLANIGNGAHVGGLVFGLLAGAWFFRKGPRPLVLGTMSAFVIASILSLFWSPWSTPWVGYKAYSAQVAGRSDQAISAYRHYMAKGGDRAWALGNLAELYRARGSAHEYEATLAELKAIDPAAAAEVEASGGTPPAH